VTGVVKWFGLLAALGLDYLRLRSSKISERMLAMEPITNRVVSMILTLLVICLV
jgi:hypothetical protein